MQIRSVTNTILSCLIAIGTTMALLSAQAAEAHGGIREGSWYGGSRGGGWYGGGGGWNHGWQQDGWYRDPSSGVVIGISSGHADNGDFQSSYSAYPTHLEMN